MLETIIFAASIYTGSFFNIKRMLDKRLKATKEKGCAETTISNDPENKKALPLKVTIKW